MPLGVTSSKKWTLGHPCFINLCMCSTQCVPIYANSPPFQGGHRQRRKKKANIGFQGVYLFENPLTIPQIISHSLNSQGLKVFLGFPSMVLYAAQKVKGNANYQPIKTHYLGHVTGY